MVRVPEPRVRFFRHRLSLLYRGRGTRIHQCVGRLTQLQQRLSDPY